MMFQLLVAPVAPWEIRYEGVVVECRFRGFVHNDVLLALGSASVQPEQPTQTL